MEATATPTTPRTTDCHDKITKFFNRVKAFFTQIVPNYIDAHIVGVLTFVTELRAVIENPTLDGILERLIPQITPSILSAIGANLDRVITLLGMEAACKDCVTFDDKIHCLADQLALMPKDQQDLYLHGIAVLLSKATSADVTMTQTELAALVAFAENELAHAKNAPAVS